MIAPSARMMSLAVSHTGQRLRKLCFLMTDNMEESLYQILQILSLMLFEKVPVLQALQPSDSQNESGEDVNQLILWRCQEFCVNGFSVC
jgi:hypothetical protein